MTNILSYIDITLSKVASVKTLISSSKGNSSSSTQNEIIIKLKIENNVSSLIIFNKISEILIFECDIINILFSSGFEPKYIMHKGFSFLYFSKSS